MTHLPWGWLAAAAVLGFWMLGAYNRITALRGAIGTAWQQLDALIQARQQALGALLDAVEPTLATERPALDAMVAAQVQVATAAEVLRRRPAAEEPPAVLAKAEAAIGAAQSRLLALVDQHAHLKANETVATQLRTLADLAPRDRFARQTFNEAASAYNLALDQFPTRLLVRVFGFQRGGTL
ncbi:LemA family protein [Ideonella sp. A 288]|uniref:LemA family protein n=1 Tax=Ideonella sp. A 288 TaxID=1962181 RepID=UPI000B4B3502|nr:LemA family protein [Ideonella sp. A 288]